MVYISCTSLYIKAIFDFCLDDLMQNLDFEVRLATWNSCYVTYIVVDLQQFTKYLRQTLVLM